jgi:uncharacterized membrane protein YfcA
MTLGLGLGAIDKGATGMGLPLVELPEQTTFVELQHAVALMTVPMLYSNIFQVWNFRDHYRDQRLSFLPVLLVGGVAGVLVGTWALTNVPERALLVCLGILLMAYVGLRLATPHRTIGPATARLFAPLAGFGAGALQGATGVSSPIGVTFIHAMSLGRGALVFAISAMFLLFAITQFAFLTIAGVMTVPIMVEGFLALIPLMIFMPLGQRLAARLSREAFDRMILIFLGVVGVKLLLGV